VSVYDGHTTIHLGDGRENFLLLPIIPPRKASPSKAKVAKPARRAVKKRR
jgi:hypothetical protein